jgi:putative ABC transport system permease protein
MAEIVGVAGNVSPDKLEPDRLAQNWPTIYNPYPQTPFSTMEVAVRTAGEPRSLATAVEREVHALDPEQPVANIRSMDAVAESALGAARFNTFVLAAFAGIAFVLAAVGIYGVMAYDVSERINEMGIRMALGAQDGHILRLVLGQGARMAGCGIAIGLAGAFFASRFLEKMLFAVKPTDVYTFAGVALVLGVVALAACYVPSRRATRLDPMTALRHE